MADIRALEQEAIAFAKHGDFGPDARRVNEELAAAAPLNQGAWTRLARCHMEASAFEEAFAALEKALELNPSNSIARNLQADAIRRRAARPVTSAAASGFTPQDFSALSRLAPTDAMAALGPKIETLLLSLNEQRIAKRIIEARTRAGLAGAKLYHRNSYHSTESGHIYAYHHGGRWEPQFNIGFYGATESRGSSMRFGIGFNLSNGGRDPDRADGQEQAVAYFEQFQAALSGAWRGHLIEWMGKSSGFIELGTRGPATDLLPKQAVETLITSRNAVGIGWIFVGRWLFLDRADDAQKMAEMRLLVADIDDTFAALFPLWVATMTARD